MTTLRFTSPRQVNRPSITTIRSGSRQILRIHRVYYIGLSVFKRRREYSRVQVQPNLLGSAPTRPGKTIFPVLFRLFSREMNAPSLLVEPRSRPLQRTRGDPVVLADRPFPGDSDRPCPRGRNPPRFVALSRHEVDRRRVAKSVQRLRPGMPTRPPPAVERFRRLQEAAHVPPTALHPPLSSAPAHGHSEATSGRRNLFCFYK